MTRLSDCPLAEVTFAAIDFESAGEERGMTDVPIQVGIAEMSGGDIPLAHLYRTFIATDRPVTLAARKVHGITNAHLEGAPELLSLWPELRGRLSQRIVVGHNLATERRFLRAFPFHGFGPWVDTLAVARAYCPSLASYRLGDLVQMLGLEVEVATLCPGLKWHDALYDAVASLVLLRKIIAEADIASEPAHILTDL